MNIIHNINKSEAIRLLDILCLKIAGIYKNIVLIFSLFKKVFFFAFLFSMYIKWLMVCAININIGTVMKNPKTLKFVPDHVKTKQMCKHAVKKLPYLLRYVPDR